MKKIYLLLFCALFALNAFAQLTGADEIPTTVIHERPVDEDHLLGNGTNFREYGPTVTWGIGKFMGVKLKTSLLPSRHLRRCHLTWILAG